MELSIVTNAETDYMSTKFLISVVGATAIGKTALSIKLAQHYHTEIVSCDSRQFYKEMEIGTAVPTAAELKAAKHHFIQNRSIHDDYSVGQFEKDALETIDKLHEIKELVIMVGGSGLYADAVTKGLDYFPPIAPEIRENLNAELEEKGLESLQLQLKEMDPETYTCIELENPHRVIRALEVCIGSGEKYSSFKNRPKAPRNFKTIKIGLQAERSLMYERINQRVDIMVQQGLVEEAKALYPNSDLNALQTVGYRELFQHFSGQWDLDFAISEIKKNTRRFAKRQVTWNKRDSEIFWFEHDAPFEQITDFVDNSIRP